MRKSSSILCNILIKGALIYSMHRNDYRTDRFISKGLTVAHSFSRYSILHISQLLNLNSDGCSLKISDFRFVFLLVADL